MHKDENQLYVTERSMYIRPQIDIYSMKRFRRARLYNKSTRLSSELNQISRFYFYS
jgi:hypothetical protein